MKKIEPKLQKISPQQEAEALEKSFNFLKNKEKKVAEPAPEKPARRPGRPKKRASKSAEAPGAREGKTRLTIDLPTDVYNVVNQHKEDTGQNFTHLIVSLLRKHFNLSK